VVHLRIVVPSHNAEHALHLLDASPSVCTSRSASRRLPNRVPVVAVKVVIVLAAFAVGVGLAELFGAKNLGTALGVGQLTFVVGLLYVLMRR